MNLAGSPEFLPLLLDGLLLDLLLFLGLLGCLLGLLFLFLPRQTSCLQLSLPGLQNTGDWLLSFCRTDDIISKAN